MMLSQGIYHDHQEYPGIFSAGSRNISQVIDYLARIACNLESRYTSLSLTVVQILSKNIPFYSPSNTASTSYTRNPSYT